MENVVKNRIIENKNLFKSEELVIIKNNMKIIKKIYLLGLHDGRDIYIKN